MITSTLLLALAPLFQAPVDAELSSPAIALEPQTYVVTYGEDLGLRDRLIRVASVRTDSSGFVIADLDARLAAHLQARGAELFEIDAPERDLWIVPAEHMALVPELGAQLIFQPAGGAPAVFALVPASATRLQAALGAHGHGHCGLAPVGTRAIAPAPTVYWQGRQAASGALAMSAADPRVQTLVDSVQKANISAKVSSLSSIFTRRADSSGAVTAQNDIQGWLNGFGLSTSTQQFSSSYSRNVVAEIPGTTSPEKIVVIGAHYDSVNWADGSSAISPGADDNASGSAGVIEAARALALGGPYENTLRFVLFSGEELGLLGSGYNASQSKAAGEEIIAMLNMDMIAYRAPGDARDVDFATNNTSSSLTAFCDAIGALYVPSWASTSGVLTAGSSDHASYNSEGFPAVFYFEDLSQYYQNIHTALDTMALATTDFDLATMIVQGVVASAASLAEPVDMNIAHTPLLDSLDGVGPYLVSANITSQTAASVSSVTLHYSTDGVNFTGLPMASVGNDDYEALIPGLGSPVTISYWIEALDTAGGSEIEPTGADLGATPHSFFVGQKTVIYTIDFEGGSDAGWTHGQIATQDDWQRNVPNGLGGDPSSAVSGSFVWGNDLGPSGFNGTYQPNVNNWLRSPSLDASGTTSLNLEFERWLTVEDATYDQAQVVVNGQVVWENSSAGDTVDSAWNHMNLDITAQGAGDPSLQIEFRLISDGGVEFGGWNIDDVVLSVQGPAPPPPAPNFTLAPSSVPAIGWVPITATGTGLGGVTNVTIGGFTALFTQGAGEVTFLAPPATSLAPMSVQITTAAGVGNGSVAVIPSTQTALAGDNEAAPGGFANLTVGSASMGGVTWLIFSPFAGPTSLPGIVDFSIGGGNLLSLFIVGSGTLNAAGNWSVTLGLPSGSGLSGLTLQLEGLVFDPVTGFSVSGAWPFTVL